jgi:homoserine dehydrogenase
MKLALIGFGVVGQGLAEILLTTGAELKAQYGFDAQIVAVCDTLKGSLYHPDGLDIAAALKALESPQQLATYPDQAGLVRGLEALETIRQSNAEVVVEVSYTNIQTGQPALDHFKAALQAGKHVVTTNKGPIALAYQELKALADSKGLQLLFEGTVMSGTPTIRMGMVDLAGCRIHEVRGILNGTTNYILTQMENGQDYAQALAQAQQLGYAEADPTADVEGYDALSKVLILANTVMGGQLRAEQVARQGITTITADDIQAAAQAGERWKLIGSVKLTAQGIEASVQPMRLPISDPLANIQGATNAVTFSTDLLGAVTLVGPGAGKQATGFALLSDLLAIHQA